MVTFPSYFKRLVLSIHYPWKDMEKQGSKSFQLQKAWLHIQKKQVNICTTLLTMHSSTFSPLNHLLFGVRQKPQHFPIWQISSLSTMSTNAGNMKCVQNNTCKPTCISPNPGVLPHHCQFLAEVGRIGGLTSL